MNYYITQWRQQTKLSNGQSLGEAHDHALMQLAPTPNDSGQALPERDDSDEAAQAKMQKDIWGDIYTEALPPALAEAHLLQQTGIAPPLFFDDSLYSPCDRGYLLARIIIDNQTELVKRVAETVRRNAEAVKRNAERTKKSKKPSKPNKAKKVNQYRRRRRS